MNLRPVLLLLPLVTAHGGELDEGLDGSGFAPVFVRMADQRFSDGKDYPAFRAAHREAARGPLRKRFTADLKARADASWNAVADGVRELERGGGLRAVQRYWIVNGFAAEADAAARRALAADPAVSFVYRQRLARVPLHRRGIPAGLPEARRAVYRKVLDTWRDDREDPVEAKELELPWNLRRIRADRAWAEEGATGAGVVVALCDSGLMVTPSLIRALWKNPGESLNGKDDDGNGYPDDLFGYDFAGLNAYALGDGPAMTHGSMCAGIVAGRPLNARKLATGVAPRARLMVLRGMGFLQAYEYALDNGADILSMSFMWPGIELGDYRGLYRLAHEHLAAAGVLSVGGAGNFGAGRRAQPRGRQIALPKDIPCVVAVAGVLEDGSRPPFSSAGPCWWEGVRFYDDYSKRDPLRKPDLSACIGGFPVWGRIAMAPRAGWELVSDEGGGMGLVIGPRGNSFSGPHAAGVAALVWSVAPELPAWEVKRLLEATCRDLGEPGWDPLYGAGMLDALAAVRAARAAVRE